MNINQKYTKTNIIFKKNSNELKYHKIKNTNQKKRTERNFNPSGLTRFQ